MIAKDAIAPQIIPISPRQSSQLELSAADSDSATPIVDSEGRYLGMTSGAARPVKASTPMSLVLERMVSGDKTVPVVDDITERYIGAIDRDSALAAVSSLFPQLDEYTELTVTCKPSQYSASAIAHAVEDADAHLLNLNVTAGTEPDSHTTVMLRVNHSRGESVARSLQRYGYETVEMTGDPGMFYTDMTERVNALLHYLEI